MFLEPEKTYSNKFWLFIYTTECLNIFINSQYITTTYHNYLECVWWKLREVSGQESSLALHQEATPAMSGTFPAREAIVSPASIPIATPI